MHSFRLKTIHPKFQLKNHPKNRHPFSHVVPFFLGGGLFCFLQDPNKKMSTKKKEKTQSWGCQALDFRDPDCLANNNNSPVNKTTIGVTFFFCQNMIFGSWMFFGMDFFAKSFLGDGCFIVWGMFTFFLGGHSLKLKMSDVEVVFWTLWLCLRLFSCSLKLKEIKTHVFGSWSPKWFRNLDARWKNVSNQCVGQHISVSAFSRLTRYYYVQYVWCFFIVLTYPPWKLTEPENHITLIR